MAIDYASLSRDPDFDAPDLQAYDATDLLLCERAAQLSNDFRSVSGGETVVIGDRHGALTLSLTLPREAGGHGLRGVRVHQDPLLSERTLNRNALRIGGDTFLQGQPFAHHPLDESLVHGAELVLMQLPKSLEELRESVSLIARYAAPDVTLLAGGRVKHMTLTQNQILKEYFENVRAELAHKKSRVLTATSPRPHLAPHPFPLTGTDPDLASPLFAYGATFGGPTLDHGSRLLISQLQRLESEPQRIVDLGCGNGSLTLAATHTFPKAEVIASDQSQAAVKATRDTVAKAGLSSRVRVVQADGCEAIPDAWADLILLNPPFHTGQVVNEQIAHRLIDQTVRALAPTGMLLMVFNSHLRHRRFTAQRFPVITQMARDSNFTVIAAAHH